MFTVGEGTLGYTVVRTDGDMVYVLTPGAIEIGFSRTGITGGLREVLGLIGVPVPPLP